MDIHGRRAVVTGAASGIGRAVAIELARRGAEALALVDADSGVEDVAAAIRGEGDGHVRSMTFRGDVTEDTFRQRVFAEFQASCGLPTICVPAAGITRDALSVRIDKASGRPLFYPVDEFRQVIEVDLIAPVYWALELVACVAADRRARNLGRWEPGEHVQGAVIFIGSISAHGNRGQIAYAAAKSGLEGAAATLMKESMFFGVRCGVIHPGFTDTPMVKRLGDAFVSEHILPYTQLRRLIRPEEIADAICFMVGNSAVSGQLWADAGWHPKA